MPGSRSVYAFLRPGQLIIAVARLLGVTGATPATDRGSGGVIDAHHHVWDLNVRPQPWLSEDGLELLRRSFDMTDLTDAAAGGLFGRPLQATVLVQCLPSVPETEEFLRLAVATDLLAGVVGWVDLTDPGVGSELDRLATSPGGDWLVGIRHLVQVEPDPMWLMRDDVRRGLDAVAARGLSFDLLVRPHQLKAAAALAQRTPTLSLVLDHAAKPQLRDGDLRAWAADIRALAASPQVTCKLSGLVTEADHRRWTVEDLRPATDVLLDCFGPQRLMFGSDWPVCVVAGGWASWAAAVEDLLAPLSTAELDQVLNGTATRAYGLRIAQEA
jgi:L-fuconolactonase